MPTEELSKEQENHLYNLSTIPFTIAFVVIMAYFVYLMQSHIINSVAEYLLRIGLLMGILEPIVFFGTFELLYARKTKTPISFHAKRFAGKIILAFTMIASLFGFLGFLLNIAPTNISEPFALIFSFVAWSIMWTILTLSFKPLFSRLLKGQW